MAIEELDKKGTAYLQGIQGLDYLSKVTGYKKPMNILKTYLRRSKKNLKLSGLLQHIVRVRQRMNNS